MGFPVLLSNVTSNSTGSPMRRWSVLPSNCEKWKKRRACLSQHWMKPYVCCTKVITLDAMQLKHQINYFSWISYSSDHTYCKDIMYFNSIIPIEYLITKIVISITNIKYSPAASQWYQSLGRSDWSQSLEELRWCLVGHRNYGCCSLDHFPPWEHH